MNCKQGDFARLVSQDVNQGVLVRVIEPSLSGSLLLGSFAWRVELLQSASVFQVGKKAYLRFMPGHKLAVCRDSHLRPIPPDELATWDTSALDIPAPVEVDHATA